MVRFDSIGRMVPIVLMIGLLLPVLAGNGCPGSGDGTGTGSRNSPIASIQVSGTPRVGETITLTGSGTGGQGNYVYTWAPDESIPDSEIEGSLHATQIRFTPSKAGGYRFTLAVTDAGGLGRTGTDSIVVAVNERVTVTVASNYLVTLGTPTTFKATPSGGDGNYKISWSLVRIPDGADYSFTGADTFTPTFKPMTRGRYFFEVLLRDGGGNGQEARTETVAITPGDAGLLSLTWEPNFNAGGYKMVAVFDEHLDKSTAEMVDNYRISGTDILPSSAVLSSNLQMVTLIFQTPMGRSSLIDLSVNGGIIDTTGAPVAPVQNKAIAANQSDILVPELAAAIWQINQIDQYRYDLVFSEAMDRDVVENADLYRITRMDTWATSATLGNDGKTVTVAFNKKALSTSTEFDVGVASALQDINGRPLPALQKLTIQPNTKDTDPPRIVAGSIMHAPDFSNGGYKITVQFNEVMSQSEVEDTAGWQVNGNSPGMASLRLDGRTVDLQFYSPALSITDRMNVGLFGLLRDINQNPVTLVNSQVILPSPYDVNQPRVVYNAPRYSANWDGGGYRVELDFSEAMDNASATELSNYRIPRLSDPEPSIGTLSSLYSLDMFGMRGYLIWYNTLRWWSDLSGELMDISLGDSVKDINGKIMFERRNVPIEANILDTLGPYAETVQWGINQSVYTVIVKYNEAMDSATTEYRLNYRVTHGGEEEEDNPFYPSNVAFANDGMTATLTFTYRRNGFQSGGTLDNEEPPDQLLISSSVRDINLQPYPRNPNVEWIVINQNPEDKRPPQIVGTPTIYGSRGPIYIEFDEVLNLRSITPGNFSATDAVGESLCPRDADGNAVSAIENATLLQNGRTVVVTLKQEVESGLCRGLTSGDEFTIRNIEDINGNPMVTVSYIVP